MMAMISPIKIISAKPNPMAVATFMRDPLARFINFFLYVKKQPITGASSAAMDEQSSTPSV